MKGLGGGREVQRSEEIAAEGRKKIIQDPLQRSKSLGEEKRKKKRL